MAHIRANSWDRDGADVAFGPDDLSSGGSGSCSSQSSCGSSAAENSDGDDEEAVASDGTLEGGLEPREARVKARKYTFRSKVPILGAGALLLGVAGVLNLWIAGWLEADVATSFLGSSLGLLPGVARMQFRGSGSPLRGRPRLLLISSMVAATALVVAFAWWSQVGSASVGTWLNSVSILLLLPLALACVAARHPPSAHARDAVWSVVGLWAIVWFWVACQGARDWKWLHSTSHQLSSQHGHEPRPHHAHHARETPASLFCKSAALHLEGVTLVWIAGLMVRRFRQLQEKESWARRHSFALIGLMGLSFHCKMWAEAIFPALHLPDTRMIYIPLTMCFLSIWIFYTGILARCLGKNVLLLRMETLCVRGPAKAEAMWAARVLCWEFVACLALCITTTSTWMVKLEYKLLKDSEGMTPMARRWLYALICVHRTDYLVHGVSVAMLSGLLWQTQSPSKEELHPQLRRADTGSWSGSAEGLRERNMEGYAAKVEELANRGVRLRDLMDFWGDLLEGRGMPSFDPRVATTNDVVRQAIIPLSRDDPRPPGVGPGSPGGGAGGGGSALASVWSRGAPVLAARMVTHNWSNLFWHLLSAIVADALGKDCYEGVADTLASPKAFRRLRHSAELSEKLDSTYWICAFCVNQHASICGGFGPVPPEGTREREEWDAKRCDTATGEEFQLCRCSQRKIFNSEPALCEINKFDDLMQYLHRKCPGFSHLIVVDAAFEVFSRAWCVAEIVESNLSGIPQRIKIHSLAVLDLHYESLSSLDVRDCQASRAEDRDMILAGIADKDAFNTQLRWSIFGTEGLFSKWVDGQERAALVGRIVARARTASADTGRSGGGGSGGGGGGGGGGQWPSAFQKVDTGRSGSATDSFVQRVGTRKTTGKSWFSSGRELVSGAGSSSSSGAGPVEVCDDSDSDT